MKSAAFALAGLLGSAAANIHGHQHHNLFHRSAKGPSADTCGCATSTEYYYGEATLVPGSYGSMTSKPSVPTPDVKTLPPGTHTIPAQTVTIKETTTVCAATTTAVTPGPNTIGGTVTVVDKQTTVTCPVAAVETQGGTVTSIIKTTTYVCPSAGTYTIGASTTDVATSTVLVYPVPATYPPGTYTQPEQTITVTKSDFVTICPYTSAGLPAPAAPTNAAPAPAPAPAQPTGAAPPAYSPPQTGGGSSISTNGNQWAMTYTPYTQDGNCKTADEVNGDIASIKGKGFTTVRLYGTDCSGLQNVGGAAKANGLKLIVGIFINNSGVGGAQAQLTDIVNWCSQGGNLAIVAMVVVGNEAVFNKFTSAGELAGFISQVKGTLSGIGYSGPVTTTEPLNILQEIASTICGVIDVVAANIQPFFNGDVAASDAGKFVASQLQLVAAACPGKPAYNLETGWPSSGGTNRAAVPGAEQQKAALQSIMNEVGSKSVVFSFDDDHWKDGGEFGVEKYWGCAKNF